MTAKKKTVSKSATVKQTVSKPVSLNYYIGASLLNMYQIGQHTSLENAVNCADFTNMLENEFGGIDSGDMEDIYVITDDDNDNFTVRRYTVEASGYKLTPTKR